MNRNHRKRPAKVKPINAPLIRMVTRMWCKKKPRIDNTDAFMIEGGAQHYDARRQMCACKYVGRITLC